ncbi:hypothetical protein [Paenibacillus sp. FSL K6-0108]|uniref:hypothetical protein n=1 Tax=Paenibacillus sp. FSL K6-0108 TaxID=2921417 RepID=UPI003253518B
MEVKTKDDPVYLDKMKEVYDAMPQMPHRFYRVYHMKDGRQITMGGSPHLTEDEAIQFLWYFHPSQNQGADDMADVDHVIIEKRYLPYGYFD